jgi:hypothetical protein
VKKDGKGKVHIFKQKNIDIIPDILLLIMYILSTSVYMAIGASALNINEA